jgi:cytochrome c556
LWSLGKAVGIGPQQKSAVGAAFGNIGKNDCRGCHEKYRVKKG